MYDEVLLSVYNVWFLVSNGVFIVYLIFRNIKILVIVSVRSTMLFGFDGFCFLHGSSFCDVEELHFTKIFKLKYDMPPTEYKKSH